MIKCWHYSVTSQASFSGVVGSSALKLPSSFLVFLVFLDFLSSSNFNSFILYQTFSDFVIDFKNVPQFLLSFLLFHPESYFRLIFLFSSYNLNYKCYSEKRSTLRHFIFSIISYTYYSNRHCTSQSYISLDCLLYTV